MRYFRDNNKENLCAIRKFYRESIIHIRIIVPKSYTCGNQPSPFTHPHLRQQMLYVI